MTDFIQRLPKAELHVHLEGTVEPQTLAELSHRHAGTQPLPGNKYEQSCPLKELSPAAIAELYQYKDFQGFMMAFKAVTERLRAPEDYELITYEILSRLKSQNVLHAEAYVSVGVVHWRGQQFTPIFEGLERGRRRGEKDFGMSLLWIFDAVRHFGAQPALRVAEEAIRCRQESSAVAGFGIGGDERRSPAEVFRDVFRMAREHGLRLTAHAGETAGPESVWAAINIGAERIGHALTAGEDPELIAVLAERQIPVEVCVSSNLRTQCCRSVAEHPVKKYFDAGLMVTISTDDPAMFGTSLVNEYELLRRNFEFTDEQLREVARNSFEASFLPAEKKLQLLQCLDLTS